MPMPYPEYRYLYPPRPDTAVPPGMLGFYQKRNWHFQVKKNGTCNVIAVSGKKFECRQRHGAENVHKAWTPDAQYLKPFLTLLGKGWYVFAAELLHSKTTDIKNKNYIFDIMVCNGEYLVGSTFAERQKILYELFSSKLKEEHYSHWNLDEHVWLAKTFGPEHNMKDFYDSLENIEDEGLVIKNPTGRLELCTKEKSNGSWMVKCRKEHKNFSF